MRKNTEEAQRNAAAADKAMATRKAQVAGRKKA
jgi:hypothetical protein